jgi:O-antigen ligase
LIRVLNDENLNSIIIFFTESERFGNFNGFGANTFAYLCSVGFLGGIVLISHHFSRVVGLFSIVVCGVGMVASHSLGSIIPMAVIFLLVFVKKLKNKPLVLSIFAVTLIMIARFVSFESLWDYIYNIMNLGEKDLSSLSTRTNIWGYCLEKIYENPFWGILSSNYGIDPSLGVLTYDAYGKIIKDVLTPHNIFISYITYYGIPLGGLLILSIIYSTTKTYLKTLSSSSRSLALIPIFGLIVHMSIDAWYIIFIWLFAIISIPSLSENNKVVEKLPPNTFVI